MRILVLSNYFPPDFRGGFEISAHLICQALASKGHEVTVITRENATAQKNPEDNFEVLRVFKINHSMDAMSKYPARLHGWLAVDAVFKNGCANLPILRRHLKSRSYDLALCFNLEDIGASLATELARQGLTVLWSIGDYWIYERRSIGLDSKLGRLNRKLSSRTLSDELNVPWKYVIFNCENIHTHFTAADCEPEHTFIVNRSCPEPPEILDYRDSRRRRVFMAASQIRHHKGIHILVEAAGLLAAMDVPLDWTVEVFGTGDEAYIAGLNQRIQELGLQDRFLFMGKVPQKQIAQEMGRCLAFVHPAIWDEPFGRVTMEALAYAAPLISADSGAVYEIPTTECALIYDRFDPAALADAMKQILLNPEEAEAMIERGRKRYLERFRPEIEAQRMQDVIAEVMRLEGKPMAG